jgi:hypothetical protein
MNSGSIIDGLGYILTVAVLLLLFIFLIYFRLYTGHSQYTPENTTLLGQLFVVAPTL